MCVHECVCVCVYVCVCVCMSVCAVLVSLYDIAIHLSAVLLMHRLMRVLKKIFLFFSFSEMILFTAKMYHCSRGQVCSRHNVPEYGNILLKCSVRFKH